MKSCTVLYEIWYFDTNIANYWQVAKRFIETALYYSKELAIGDGPQGPFDQFMRLKGNNHHFGSRRHGMFDPNTLFLYAVTDSKMNTKWERSIVDAVTAAIEGGATIVQLRFTFLAYMLIKFFSRLYTVYCTLLAYLYTT